MKKIKDKMTLHPVMSFILLIGVTIVLSAILSLLGFQSTQYKINANTLDYSTEILKVSNLFSLQGIKYIFTSTVSNFVAFAPLSSLIIVLIGLGVMEKSGLLKTLFAILTKKMKKNTVTFTLVLISIIASIIGDLSYIIIIPIAALLYKYGKRNPKIGIIAAFAGLTCGAGLSFILTSTDSVLLSTSLLAAQMIDKGYRIATIGTLFIMFISVIILATLITWITEKYIVDKLEKYEVEDDIENDLSIGRKELRGLIISGFATVIYVIIFLYNIIPGLPFSGNLLDNSQILYIDKLFSYNSFFSNGFVFIVTILFVIAGLFYGIGSKTIKNNKDFVDALGHSLDGIGKTLVLIFMASAFINVFKYTSIGNVMVAAFANLIKTSGFVGIPLIILLFVLVVISTIFLPSSISKWSILAPLVVPVFMNAGVSPEFTQVIFRFAEGVTMGLTPVLAYFVIYIAFLNHYNADKKPVSITQAMKFQFPYALGTAIILLLIIIIWYIAGLPLGINGVSVL